MAQPDGTPHIIRIHSEPGIKRDGTMLEGKAHVDGKWVRWQRGIARKIAGYRAIDKYLVGLPRALFGYTQDAINYVHAGSASLVERLTISPGLTTSVISDRTPASLVADADNVWQFDAMADLNGDMQLIAQVAPNLDCICSADQGQLFYGGMFATTDLDPVTALPATYSVSGGVVALAPYAVAFGSNGFVMWSVPGDPSDYTGSGAGFAYVTDQKIVRAAPLRGGAGNAPSALLWSVDSLLRMTYVGGTVTFQFDTLATQTSIIAPRSVIDYDGVFYWVANDRFMMFNGVVREVQNDLNSNFFFDNMNWNRRQTVFAYKVPRYGEIWWCFPFGDSQEPNHAVIYNVRENTWYDTPLPNGGRGAGTSPVNFRFPLLTGVEDDDGYRLWIHERGTDEIDGLVINPIESYYETGEYALPIDFAINKAVYVDLMEPDFVQSGDMTVQVMGRANSRSPEVASDPVTIYETAETVDQQVVYFKTQRRQLRFRFTSNIVGGDYQEGIIMAHVKPADATVRG